jgi:hypothetical protein
VKHLYEAIQEQVIGWRSSHYPRADYPAIGEILESAVPPESDNLRFLRRPQHRAPETHWYFRLNMDRTVFKAQITDWRAMVDSVMIDTAYDGQVFNVALTDVPERKVDLVAGRYELPAPTGPATVAVKITDMLGEEVLVAKRLE